MKRRTNEQRTNWKGHFKFVASGKIGLKDTKMKNRSRPIEISEIFDPSKYRLSKYEYLVLGLLSGHHNWLGSQCFFIL